MVNNYVPLSEKQKALLHEIYYDDNIYYGRDKLFKYIRANHPDCGISRRDVMEWLKQQKPWQITKRPLKRVKTSLMDIQKPGYMSCDLAGPMMRDNKKSYIFVLCDVASRMTYAKAIDNSSAACSALALEEIIQENPDMKLTLLRTDNGSSFKGVFSEYLRLINVKQLFSAPGPPWSNRSERQIGVLKAMLEKHYIIRNSKRWVKVLPKLVKAMNTTVCCSIHVTPESVELDGLPITVNERRSKYYGVMTKFMSKKSTFKEGDRVRVLLRPKGNFEKQRRYWSEEIYVITKVIHATNKRLVTYKINKNKRLSYNVTELLA